MNWKQEEMNTINTGCNKLLFARNCAKEVFFVFSFDDGLFYYKFNNEDYDTGIIRSAYGGRDNGDGVLGSCPTV